MLKRLCLVSPLNPRDKTMVKTAILYLINFGSSTYFFLAATKLLFCTALAPDKT